MPDGAENPLLKPWKGPLGSPDFRTVRAEDFLPAIEAGIAEARAEIAAITGNPAPPDFDNTVAALERSGERLSRVRRLFWMLSSAHGDAGIRAIESPVSSLLSAWGTEVSHDQALFERIAAVWRDRARLGPEQCRLVENSYKGFVAGGAGLGGEDKRRFAEIDEKLSSLSVRFGQNVLAATNAAELVIEPSEAAGLPPDMVASAASAAAARGLNGRLHFTLERGVFEALTSFAAERRVREAAWRGFNQRCQSGAFDNNGIAAEIVALRQEKAALLGYPDYASYALEDSMARNPDAAEGLMTRVWTPGLRQARHEALELQSLVDRDQGGFTLAAWDWRYFAERLRRERYDYDSAAIRANLSLGKVRSAAMSAAERLYGLRFEQRGDVSVYQPSVTAWEVRGSNGEPVGLLYTDYQSRPEKHGGAWMGSLRVQEKLDGPILPIVYTVANFGGPGGEADTFLSLDEARTLFHEFGHALHALLSDVTYPSLAGTSVPRDFVEFPSKLMEHWVASPDALRALGVPAELAAAVARADQFGQGFSTVEFLASAMLDLALHRTLPPPGDIALFEADCLKTLDMPDAIGMRHRLACFTHVFDGGYASAYYSYLWSEVLDADVFEAFTAAGDLYDPELSARLRREVLAPGDSRDPLTSFVAFRGRPPEEAALLRSRCLA